MTRKASIRLEAFGLILVAVAMTWVAILSMGLLAAAVGQDRYRSVAREAINAGTLAKRQFIPFGGASAGFRYNHNDCLILSMLAVTNEAKYWQTAMSPPVPQVVSSQTSGTPKHDMCGQLETVLASSQVNTGYYHRYIHGTRAVAGVLLAFLPFDVATTILLLMVAVFPVLIVVSVGRKMRLGTERRDLAFFGIALGILILAGLDAYDWSLSFAPGDAVLTAFVFLAWRRPFAGLSTNKTVLICALFGSLIAALEFLTGLFPSGIALICASVAIDVRRYTHPLRLASLTLTTFIAAFLLMFALKAFLVSSFWAPGDLVQADAGKVFLWMKSDQWDLATGHAVQLGGLGLTVNDIKNSRVLATTFAFAKMAYFSAAIEWGSLLLGLAAVVIGPILLIILAGWNALTGSGKARTQGLLFLAAAGAIIGWYAVFVSHTIVHSYFMVRPLTWLSILLVGYIIMLIPTKACKWLPVKDG